MKAPVSFILLFLMLAACGSQPPVPEDHYYRLPDVQHKQKDSKLPGFLLDKTITIERLSTEGLYQERAILYIDEHHPLELRRYHYHNWVNSPVNIISEHLLSYLGSVSSSTDISRYIEGHNTDKGYRISGKLIRFERVINNGNPKAVVTLELWLGTNKNPRLFNNKYSANVQASGSSMHDTAIAFGSALEEIYANFMQDLNKEN